MSGPAGRVTAHRVPAGNPVLAHLAECESVGVTLEVVGNGIAIDGDQGIS